MRENEKLPVTVITPTTKARDGEHDEPIAPAEIIGRGLLSAAQWDEVSATAMALFARGREIAAGRGLILVDTKYEFGLDCAGRIVLADEIHTPDSSRYWFAESYQRRFASGEPPDSFDKDFLRRWVAARCDPYRDELPPIPRDVIAADRRRVYPAPSRQSPVNRSPPPIRTPRRWRASAPICAGISEPCTHPARSERHSDRGAVFPFPPA